MRRNYRKVDSKIIFGNSLKPFIIVDRKANDLIFKDAVSDNVKVAALNFAIVKRLQLRINVVRAEN